MSPEAILSDNDLHYESNVIKPAQPDLRRFGVYSHTQLLERNNEQQQLGYLIDALLPQQSLVLAVGDSGLGKSPLLYQALICIASGRPFLGRVVKQGRVLYMDGENGTSDVGDITKRLATFIGLDKVPEDLMLWNLNNAPESWGQPGCELEDIIRRTKPCAVVIDPINSIFTDIEKDAKSTTTAYQHLRRLMSQYGFATMGSHHIRKTDGFGPTLERADLHRWFQEARGSRVLINGCDVRIGIDWLSQEDDTLIIRGFGRVRGEIPSISLGREIGADGEPVGYKPLSGAKLLRNPDHQRAFDQLPNSFRFKDAQEIYGKGAQPTRNFLKACESAGLVRRGNPYEKIVAEAGNPGVPGVNGVEGMIVQ